MSAILAALLRMFLTKAMLKKLLWPLVEEFLKYLGQLAKRSDNTLDDTAVEIVSKAAREFFEKW